MNYLPLKSLIRPRRNNESKNWKSCVGQNLTEGSNPSHCARKDSPAFAGLSFLYGGVRKAAPGKASAEPCNRRGFSAEKRIPPAAPKTNSIFDRIAVLFTSKSSEMVDVLLLWNIFRVNTGNQRRHGVLSAAAFLYFQSFSASRPGQIVQFEVSNSFSVRLTRNRINPRISCPMQCREQVPTWQ